MSPSPTAAIILILVAVVVAVIIVILRRRRPGPAPAPVGRPFPRPLSDQEPACGGDFSDASTPYAFGGLRVGKQGAASAPRVGAPPGRGPGNLPGIAVLPSSGELIIDRIDLAVPGRGAAHFQLGRRYRSRLDFDGPLGHGWTSSLFEALSVEPGGDVLRHDGQGHVDRWTRAPDGTYQGPSGYFGDLVRRQGGGFVLREPDGLKRFFSDEGRLQRLQDRHGNALRFEYDSPGDLVRVVDAYDRAYVLTWHDVAGARRVSGVRDFTGREVRYTYDAAGHLVGVRSPTVTGTSTGNDFPDGKTEQYAYMAAADPELDHKLISLTLPAEVATGGPPVMQVEYGDQGDVDNHGRVTRQVFAGPGSGGSISYRREARNAGTPPGRPGLPRFVVSVTERSGNRCDVSIDEFRHSVLVQRHTRGLRPGEPASYDTRLEYDADGQVTRIALPQGNETRYGYDSRGPRRMQGNLTEVRRVADASRGGGGDLVTTFEYEPLFSQIRSITDPRGNDPSYAPPLGTASADRYRTVYTFDYQEGSDAVPEADEWGIVLSAVARGVGDVNDDGRTDQAAGNVVRIERSSVTLRPDSEEAARRGATTVPTVHQLHWNEAGQLLREIDAEGNVNELAYFPENDPSGSGSPTPGTSGNTATGYLKTTTVDAADSPRRTTSERPSRKVTSFRYDALGSVVGIVNPRGIATELEVNELQQVVRSVRGADVTKAAASRELVTGEAAFRYEQHMFYDENDRLVRTRVENRDSATPSHGTYLAHEFQYDLLSNLVAWSAKPDPQTTLQWRAHYTANSRIERVVLPEGNGVGWVYDERDLILEKTHGVGSADAKTVGFSYDGNGNCVEAIQAEDMDGDGQAERTRLRYDGFDRLVGVIDPLDGELLRELDPAGNATRTTILGHPAGQPGAANVLLSDIRHHHDELNRAYRTDRALFVSDGFAPTRPPTLHDGDGDGFVTRFVEFDALGRVTFETDDGGHTTAYEYDGAGRMTSSTDPLGNRTTTVYDANDNPLEARSTHVSPEGLVADEQYVSFFTWDQLDRLVRVSADHTTRYAYDSRDNVVLLSDPQGVVTPDPLGVLSGPMNAAGNTVRFTHDGLDRLVMKTFELREHGQGDRPLDTSNPFNTDGLVTLRYAYDGNSRLTAIVDDAGNETRYVHDDVDRVVQEVNADGSSTRYAYDRNDNLTGVTDPNGTQVAMQYDRAGRLTRRTISPAPGVLGTTEETLAYDGLSRPTHLTDDNGDPAGTETVERVYDSLSRLIEEQQGGSVVSHALSGDGETLATIYPSARRLDFSYDEIHRVKSLAEQGTDLCRLFYIGPQSRELRREMHDGSRRSYLNDAGDRATGYDKFQRIVRERVFLADGTAVLDRAYGYNRADALISETRHDDNARSDEYRYDSLYRLTQADYDRPSTTAGRGTVAYQLDGVGNRRQTESNDGSGSQIDAYRVNEVNEYLEVGSDRYGYDKNGNLTSDGHRDFHYDYKNRLVSITRSSDGAPIARYTYDAANRRTLKEAFDPAAPGSPPLQTILRYDGWNVCEERDGSDRTLQTFVHLPQTLDAHVQLERTADHALGPGSVFPHQNHRGDVAALTDSTGVVERRFFDAFGRAYDENMAPAPSSAVGNAHGLHGRRLDGESGLYHFRNRALHPGLGRFLQRDPRWDAGNLGNQYAFVGNSPLSAVDPLGTDFVYKKGSKVYYVPEGFMGLNGTEIFVGNLDPNDSDSIRIGYRNGSWVTKSYSELETEAEDAWFSNIKSTQDLQEALGLSANTSRIEPPGFAESMIPVWGSGRMAIYEAERGGGFTNYGSYALLAATDVLLVGWLAKSALKLAGKAGITAIPAATRASLTPGTGAMRVAMNGWSWPHVIWRSGGEWVHAFGRTPIFNWLPIRPFFGSHAPRTAATLEAMLARTWPISTRIPLLSTELAAMTGGRARTCLGAALWALSRGNYHLPYFMLKGWLQLPTAHPDVRDPGSSPEDFWNAMDWNDLTESEKELWGRLGWDGENWYAEETDGLEPPASHFKLWRWLTEDERDAARRLGYDETTWDAS